MYVIVPRTVTSQSIGERIAMARVNAGMRRVDLASRAGLALNTIRNYEDGRTTPLLENLPKVADALDVELLWLLEGDRVEEVA
jgi:transcriptional regulator with XRE-family HTH domain